METISSYPKLARVRYIFWVELGFLLANVISIVVLLILLCSLLARGLGPEKLSTLNSDVLATAVVLFIVTYCCEGYLLTVLYKGINEKEVKKLVLWVFGNVAVAGASILIEAILISERRYTGGGAPITGIFILAYHAIVIWFIYDAVRELRRFPVAVPFVRMGNSEAQV